MALFALTSGQGEAETPLVLLHGFGAGAFVWDEVIGRLMAASGASACGPILAYDLPGHGRSLDSDAIGGAGRMAKAIAADLASRGLGRFHIAGHSMGGAVAALLALRRPQDVASLTLLSPGGFGPAINHRALAHYAEADTSAALCRALEAMIGFNSLLPERIIAAMLADRSRPGAHAALSTILKAMFVDPTAERLVQGQLPLSDLGALPLPVRILWGEEDTVLPVAQCAGLPSSLAVQRLAGVGHMLIEEAPEAVAEFIRSAIAEAS